MTLGEFQQLIRDRYFATDSVRGAPGTFLWFVEEIGELAEVIGQAQRGDFDDATRQARLEEEFADVLAWLTTLANIHDIDLDRAVTRKYVDDGGPKGTK